MYPTIGIDIGKTSIHVGHPTDDPNPKKWRVEEIAYSDPAWHTRLIDLIAPDAVITAESTGYHLLAPLANLIRTRRPGAVLWQAEGSLTASYRGTWLSGSKNDRLDALALTIIARDLRVGAIPRRVRPFDHAAESAAQQLRLYVNTHERLTKEQTRLLNRLDTLAHSIWPTLALKKSTWLNAVRAGAITPQQIIALAADPKGISGNNKRYLKALAADLPDDIAADPHIEAAIRDLAAQLDEAAARIAANLAIIETIIYCPPFEHISRRWATIPGAGTTYIAALHVPTRGMADQMTVDEFRAVCGINPRTSTSGSGDKTEASKRGYRPAKKALFLWTMNLVGPDAKDNPVRDYRATVKTKQDFWAARSKLAKLLVGVALRPDGYTYFGQKGD